MCLSTSRVSETRQSLGGNGSKWPMTCKIGGSGILDPINVACHDVLWFSLCRKLRNGLTSYINFRKRRSLLNLIQRHFILAFSGDQPSSNSSSSESLNSNKYSAQNQSTSSLNATNQTSSSTQHTDSAGPTRPNHNTPAYCNLQPGI